MPTSPILPQQRYRCCFFFKSLAICKFWNLFKCQIPCIRIKLIFSAFDLRRWRYNANLNMPKRFFSRYNVNVCRTEAHGTENGINYSTQCKHASRSTLFLLLIKKNSADSDSNLENPDRADITYLLIHYPI